LNLGENHHFWTDTGLDLRPLPLQPKKVYAVRELTASIKALLEERFAFLWISGEISNCKTAASGHIYFTLKDADAQIGAVMFRASARKLPRPLGDGMQVVALGRLSVYPPRGVYQFIAEFVESQGAGALLMAVEALKQKLAAEGLFNPDTKKNLPRMPGCVAVVTSPTGSVIRDILQVSGRRWPGIPIEVVPVSVQGASAVGEIVAALDLIATHGCAEAVILARGGGSIEDLMAFNDEAVVRAIGACPVPVVSAIGHETDTTLADLMADLRAPTPSAAAELVFPARDEWLDRLAELRRRLATALKGRLSVQRTAAATLTSRLKHPSRRIADGRLRLDDLVFRLEARMRALISWQRDQLSWRKIRFNDIITSDFTSIHHKKLEVLNEKLLKNIDLIIRQRNQHLTHLTARLNDLSPLNVLKRGYSITRALPRRETLRRSDQTAIGGAVEIQLSNGYLFATVTGTDKVLSNE
jgi:exodeoxyribonuclease VII large subunit